MNQQATDAAIELAEQLAEALGWTHDLDCSHEFPDDDPPARGWRRGMDEHRHRFPPVALTLDGLAEAEAVLHAEHLVFRVHAHEGRGGWLARWEQTFTPGGSQRAWIGDAPTEVEARAVAARDALRFLKR